MIPMGFGRAWSGFVSLLLGRRLQSGGPKPRRLEPEAGIDVVSNGEGIVVAFPGDSPRSLRWGDFGRVFIRTTDEGPWAPDVFWIVEDRTGQSALIFPGGASGEGEALEAMQARLPGFDNAALIKAMGCTWHAVFVLWQAEPG